MSPAESLPFAPKDETRSRELLVTPGRVYNYMITNDLTKMTSATEVVQSVSSNFYRIRT